MPKKSRIRKACKSKIAFLEEKNHFVKNVVVEHFVSMADEDMWQDWLYLNFFLHYSKLYKK